MNTAEAKFQVLEQNIQALQQTCYQILVRLTDLKIVLAGKGLLVHPEERSDIPEHAVQAKATSAEELNNKIKAFLEKEGYTFREADLLPTEPEKGDIPPHSLFAQEKRLLEKEGYAYQPVCLRSTSSSCRCADCCHRRKSVYCTGDYYGPI